MNIVSFTDQLVIIFFLSVAAFGIGMILTPLYTKVAYRYKFWKKQRHTSTTGDELTVFTKLHSDKFKRHIPTMAGIVTIVAVIAVTLCFNMDRAQTWLPLAALIGGGAMGLIDDIINIKGSGEGVAGLRSSVKFMVITLLSLVLGWYFFVKLGYDAIHIPYVGEWTIGWFIIPIFVFSVVATGNAVNISDGLDGLSGGLLAISYGSFGVIALLQGHGMLAGFCFTVLGAILAYLWFNIYPARFFMGDVGSFALGTSLGVIAMMTNALLLLPIIGLLFVVEAGSSLIQIISKKFFGKRVFISAPIHHHLEALGWPETKITMRFWVIAAVSGFIGLLIALTGGYLG